jgi:hypothetical protein
MAIPIKRIEKDFLLKVLYDEQTPIKYLKNRTEYSLVLERPPKTEIFLKTNRVIPGLQPKQKMGLMFDSRGRKITFTGEIISIKGDHIVGKVPESLYKDLDRSYSRVANPADLQVQMFFLGDQYMLSYPKVVEVEQEADVGDLLAKSDLKNFSGLVAQLAAWVKGYANGYKLVIFKDVQPTTIEERILAETGKTLYLPSTQEGLPKDDPYPKKRFITGEMFRRYLESTGIGASALDEAVTQFVGDKYDQGFFSDAWVPVLFQEYVVGYIHVWINTEGLPPFTREVIDTLYQFASVLAFSLKENGFFESGYLKNKPFQGKIVDISASGMLFAYPYSPLGSALLPDSELAVKLITANRTVNTNAKIVRKYKDGTLGFFGCQFLNMAPEDMRFFFEFIYGKPFTDKAAPFLAGQV